MQHIKKIDLNVLETTCQGFVENSNLLREKQDELETTLNEMYRNDSDFKAGKVAKQAYEFNQQRFSQEADREKKSISSNITGGLRILNDVEKLVKSQEIKLPEEQLPRKKHRKHKIHHAVHHAKKHKTHTAKKTHHAKKAHHSSKAHHAKGKKR